MPYNEFLVDKVHQALKMKNVAFEEKNMMGGIVFMVDQKMCLGISRDDLMVRIDPTLYETVVGTRGSREMDFTGRAMKGFVFVGPEGTDIDETLEYWINLALEFNPRAMSSKKKTQIIPPLQ